MSTIAERAVTDLSRFLVSGNPGVTSATFTHSAGAPATISVLFNNPFTGIDALEATMESTGPRALARSSDVADVIHGDTLEVNGTTYYIRGIHPDGSGMTELMLSEDE